MNYFVTAIGTDSGKTLVSAILCEALKADYWKPVQAGLPRDADTVAGLISNRSSVIFPEQYLLQTPASPHASAKIDGVHISLNSFQVPRSHNSLIVEGAGGCLVPLNDRDTMLDLILKLEMETVVVSNHYLGSINHTLLTVEALQARGVKIKGIIFNGQPNAATEEIILSQTKLDCLLHIDKETAITPDVVRKYAIRLKHNWNE